MNGKRSSKTAIFWSFVWIFSFLLFLRKLIFYILLILLSPCRLKLIKEGSFQYFSIDLVQIILMFTIQVLPIFFMPFYFKFCLIFTDLCSIWDFPQIRFHEFRKILMTFLPFYFFLKWLLGFFLLFFCFLLIGDHQISKFLCVVYFWLLRVNNFFVVIVMNWL